jgi:gamma-glutamyltranspeptidase/glutathione hydrolase
VLREPLRGSYRGNEIETFPPPSGGGVSLVQALQVLEGFDLRTNGPGSSAALHRIAETLKLAFADRAAWLGDPDFVAVPLARLLDPSYAAELRRRINPPRWRRAPWTWGRSEVAIEVRGTGLPPAGGGTTHLSVVDAAGNAVAITETINAPYGSWVTVPGTGILLNDEMDDVATRPGVPNAWGVVDVRGANAIAPGKRPVSSMAPTIAVRDGRAVLVTGSPGGARIVSATLQVLVNVLEFGLDVAEAVSAPRIHHQWRPDTLFAESGVPLDVLDGLRRRGHRVEVVDGPSSTETVAIDPDTGWRYGAADPRRDGLALGY